MEGTADGSIGNGLGVHKNGVVVTLSCGGMGRRTFALVALAAAGLLGTSALAATVGVPGNQTRGKTLFLRGGIFCGSCHALKAAKSVGRDGSDLDKDRLAYAAIVDAITKGRQATKRWPAGMPTYGGAQGFLTKRAIQDIAAYVYNSTH